MASENLKSLDKHEKETNIKETNVDFTEKDGDMFKSNDNKTDAKHDDDGLYIWEPYGSMTKEAFNKRVWRNIIMLSTAIMFNYISYGGLSLLQSSLHHIDGMGTICTSIRYVTLVLSCIFVPPLMIRAITHKWTITVSLLGFIVWMVANGYGVWATMIPASIINGFFVAPLWAAQGAYFTELAREYARVNKENEENRIALFFGVYYMFYTAAGIFGNTISSTVLRTPEVHDENSTDSEPTNEDIANNCGMNDCPWNELNGTNVEDVPDSVVWTLVGIYIAIALIAITCSIVFVDHLPRHLVKKSELTVRQELNTLLSSTLRQSIKKKQLLLIPLTFYMGISGSFYSAEFSRSWVTCSLGISWIGLTNIPAGVAASAVSFCGGRLVKVIGRLPIFITGLCLAVTTQTFLALWEINPDDLGVFFVVPIFWASTDAIWITLVGALYGTFFRDNTEAAFSNYMLWWCAGLAVGFGYSFALCTDAKLYIVFAMLWVGITSYFAAEYVNKQDEKTGLSLDSQADEKTGKGGEGTKAQHNIIALDGYENGSFKYVY